MAQAVTTVTVVNPIVTENQNPGTAAWVLTKQSDDVNGQVLGYASDVSVPVGKNITFQISVKPSQTYSIDIYRMGYY